MRDDSNYFLDKVWQNVHDLRQKLQTPVKLYKNAYTLIMPPADARSSLGP